MKKLFVIFAIITLTACGNIVETKKQYEDRIADWQYRQLACEAHKEEIMSEDILARGQEKVRYAPTRQKLNRIVKEGYPFTYESDEKDYWYTSEEFILNGKDGDCEDIAIFFYHLIREAKIIPDEHLYLRIIDIEGQDLDHMVLVIETDEHTLILDYYLRYEHEADRVVKTEFNLFMEF